MGWRERRGGKKRNDSETCANERTVIVAEGDTVREGERQTDRQTDRERETEAKRENGRMRVKS